MPKHNTTLVIAITMATVLNDHMKKLQNGTEKRRNKEMQQHSAILVIAIKMAMVLNNHTLRL